MLGAVTDSRSGRTWRLLVTEPTDGATNMAIDEALWRGRQAGASPPTLRFFAWAPPTVSLGYGQPLDARRRRRVPTPRRGAGAAAHRRQRDLSRRPRARADLQRGGHRRRPRSRRPTARDLPLDRAALLRGLRALGAPAEMVPERPPATGRRPPSASPAPACSRSRWRAQARGQRPAPPGRLVPAARRRCCSASTRRAARVFPTTAIRSRR